jgi:thioredoxin reductase (NADPH)
VRLLARRVRPGDVALPVLALLAVERFLVEFLRAKDDRFLGPFTVAQAISLLVLVGLLVARRWRPASAGAGSRMSRRSPRLLTIAGSDSGGGAGIQADLKTFAAHGAYGMSVITALTAQNTVGVRAVHVAPAPFVAAQIDAVFEDLAPDAVKVGMLAEVSVVEAVADRLTRWTGPPVVLDPVMIAASGDPLLRDDAIDAIRERLMPLATVVTPNLPEAERLAGPNRHDARTTARAGRRARRRRCSRGAAQGWARQRRRDRRPAVGGGANRRDRPPAPRHPCRSRHRVYALFGGRLPAGARRAARRGLSRRRPVARRGAARGRADRRGQRAGRSVLDRPTRREVCMSERIDLLILGAGPTGISVGAEARRAGLSPLLVDRGPLVASLVDYPDEMLFFTTRDRLEIAGIPFAIPEEKPNRRQAIAYYQAVAARFALPLALHEEVVDVEAEADGFRVRSRGRDGERERRAGAVVVATGYFAWPERLGVPGEDLPWVRARYREPWGHFGERVVVVGGGNSAAETALDLWHHGAQVTLVCRGAALKPTVKYWVKPDLENRIAEGSIAARFESRVSGFGARSVRWRRRRGATRSRPTRRTSSSATGRTRRCWRRPECASMR